MAVESRRRAAVYEFSGPERSQPAAATELRDCSHLSELRQLTSGGRHKAGKARRRERGGGGSRDVTRAARTPRDVTVTRDACSGPAPSAESRLCVRPRGRTNNQPDSRTDRCPPATVKTGRRPACHLAAAGRSSRSGAGSSLSPETGGGTGRDDSGDPGGAMGRSPGSCRGNDTWQ